MTVGLFVVVIPFVWMMVSSFKPEAEVRAVPPTWWPETVTTENYRQLFTKLGREISVAARSGPKSSSRISSECGSLVSRTVGSMK